MLPSANILTDMLRFRAAVEKGCWHNNVSEGTLFKKYNLLTEW